MEHKYYVELFAIDKFILYGYAANTDISEYNWSEKKIKIKNKLNIKKFTSVMNKYQLEEFIGCLRSKIVKIKDNIIIAGLHEVSRTLNIKDESKLLKDEIINKLSYKRVVWNLDKKTLLTEINDLFNNEKYIDNIINISNKIYEDIGFEIAENIEKLGNFEIFDIFNSNVFRNYANQNGDIVVEKITKYKHDVTVNITYWSEDEVVSNKIYDFKNAANEIIIKAVNNIDRVRVIIWNKESGEIIYFYDESFMGELNLTMNMASNELIIQEDWSRKIKESSSNLTKEIDNIDKVSKYTEESFNCGLDRSEIKKVKDESMKIQKLFKIRREKGCFIHKSKDKESELKCLKKIIEYVEDDKVKKCIILDPFFSILSASKLLTRIGKTNIQLEVIFSLSDKDPDTDSTNKNLIQDYKEFIHRNKNVLHENLTLTNVLSGKNQAFHDRYLIREFKDGHRDGFLLSNSINSMGQKYPFVVAPFETDVLKKVIDYIENIKNDKNYSVEELYNSKDEHMNKVQKNKKYIHEFEVLELYRKISTTSGSKLDIFEKKLDENNVEDFNDAINENIGKICEYFAKECDNNLNAFKIISLLMYVNNKIKDEIFNNFNKYNFKINSIMEYLKSILLDDKTTEKNKRYIATKQKIEKLCEKNEITIEEFNSIKRVFNSFISEFDVNNKYAQELLKLLSKIQPTKLIDLISETKAPLVYVNLLFYLNFTWDETMFKELLRCDITSFKELGYCYVFSYIEKEESDNKINFLNNMISICENSGYELLAFMLTMISDGQKNNELKEYIINRLVSYFDKNKVNTIMLNRIIFLLKCRDNIKHIENLFELVEKLNDINVKKEIGINVLCIVKERYKDMANCIYDANKDSKILWIGAYCQLMLKNNILNTSDLEDLLIKNNFRNLENPYLKDINYDKWNNEVHNFLINFIFIGNVLEIYEGENKRELINVIVNELSTKMIGLRFIEECNYVILIQSVSIVAEWIRLKYIKDDILKKLYYISPDWIQMIFLLNENELNIKKIEELIDRNIKFNVVDNDQVISTTVGEYIVLKEKLEKDNRIKDNIKNLRKVFIERYFTDKSYYRYLELLSNDETLDDNEWKIRSFGFQRIKMLFEK